MPDEIQNQITAQPENRAKQKKIYLVIGIVILLIACAAIAAVCFWPKKFSQKKPLGYYQELGNKCRNNGCCLTSVKTMSDGNFKLEPEAGCPEGFTRNMLKCLETYVWCEPVKNTEATSTEESIDTADWQTYRNEEYGYEIKYLNSWLVKGEKDKVYFERNISQEEIKKHEIDYPLIVLVENTSLKSISDWFENEFSSRTKDLKPKKYSIKIGGLDGIRYSDPISMGGCNEDFAVIRNEKLFRFLRHSSTCDYSDEIINQILSSFKFIE